MSKVARSISREAGYVQDKAAPLDEIPKVTNLRGAKGTLRELRERPKIGIKLMKPGTTIALYPDPPGDLPAGVIIASGLAIGKYWGSSCISDFKPDIRELLKGLG